MLLLAAAAPACAVLRLLLAVPKLLQLVPKLLFGLCYPKQ
jgi:hypothetical protein